LAGWHPHSFKQGMLNAPNNTSGDIMFNRAQFSRQNHWDFYQALLWEETVDGCAMRSHWPYRNLLVSFY